MVKVLINTDNSLSNGKEKKTKEKLLEVQIKNNNKNRLQFALKKQLIDRQMI